MFCSFEASLWVQLTNREKDYTRVYRRRSPWVHFRGCLSEACPRGSSSTWSVPWERKGSEIRLESSAGTRLCRLIGHLKKLGFNPRVNRETLKRLKEGWNKIRLHFGKMQLGNQLAARGLLLLEDPWNRPSKGDGSLKGAEKVERSKRVPGIFRKSEKQDLMNGHEE